MTAQRKKSRPAWGIAIHRALQNMFGVVAWYVSVTFFWHALACLGVRLGMSFGYGMVHFVMVFCMLLGICLGVCVLCSKNI